MDGYYNPHNRASARDQAETAAKAWAADLIKARANGEREGEAILLARLVPPGSGSALQAKAAFLVLADIAARSDPLLVRAVTGRPFVRPKAKSAAKGKAA
jgi:hypothetical protein